jgi:hypothetical protein
LTARVERRSKDSGGRRQWIAAAGSPSPSGHGTTSFHANDLIALEHGVDRAREITLYSSYQLPAPPNSN